jgi:hypothetical protein
MFTFDVDAEAVMLVDHPEVVDYLDVIGHQRYGPQVAVPRLLRMLDRRKLRTTFFVPGGSPSRGPTPSARSATPAMRSATTVSCTRAFGARMRRPRRGT